MLRLFDMLGRSAAMRALEDALRESGVHPLLVPDPVKLTVIKLNKKHAGVRTRMLHAPKPRNCWPIACSGMSSSRPATARRMQSASTIAWKQPWKTATRWMRS